jgi:hypothetical protein
MPSISITLSDEEQEALRQLIDAALRHAGEGALDVAALFKSKIITARSAASQPRVPVPAERPVSKAAE